MTTYPEILNKRMPYDIDNASLTISTATVAPVLANQTQLRNINSENNVNNISISSGYGIFQIIFTFPELRNITAYLINISTTPTSIQYSLDTTTGFDGTWTEIANIEITNKQNTFLDFRFPSSIIVNSGNPVKGIKFVGEASNISIKNIHLYGFKNQNSDRIEFWHPTNNEELPADYLNFGDVYTDATEQIKSFRVKNVSANKIANSIEIAANATTTITPSLQSQFSFSFSNTSYGTTGYINSLSPNSISDIIYIKRITPINANLGPYTLRITASPGAWLQL